MQFTVTNYTQGGYEAVVEWTVDGKRSRKFFRSKDRAKTWADNRNRELRSFGVGVLHFPEELRVQAQEAAFLLRDFPGRSIVDAAKLAAEHWRRAAASKEVSAAVKELIDNRESRGKRGVRGGSGLYLKDLRRRISKFVEAFGDRKISEISKAEIAAWLDNEPGGAVSRNNNRAVLMTFWKFAVSREWTRDNLVQGIERDQADPSAIGVLTPGQAEKLLAAMPRRSVPHVAIGLFCGPRRSELERLVPECDRGEHIEIGVTKTRGAARRFVRVRPNLRAWLDAYGPPEKLTIQQIRDDIENALAAADIEWPRNAMRHSFASYALAHERDIKSLTLEMGHTSPDTIFAHYRELVTPADAAAYWQITPTLELTHS